MVHGNAARRFDDKNPDRETGDLFAAAKRYLPEGSFDFIKRAYDFASIAHAGQRRKSGDPYIIHPVAVARILADLELDMVTIAAGLLHDVVEDTDVVLDDVKREFGPEVASLVDGVTKLSNIAYKSEQEHQAENLRKMFLAMAEDIRVILIKLADRLHNMRTLSVLEEQKQRQVARETLDIYAALAHRLGIFHIKWELEDLSLRYLKPELYYDLAHRVSKKREEREEFTNRVIERIKTELALVPLKAEIQGRPKHLYSIYKKMYEKGKDFHEIYDLTGVRVVVENVKDCYGALGVIHSLWTPIPGRFKDYIAMPKPNMYQSLHTTVITDEGEPLEIQIRTWEMHRTAEYGIAAHWKYKEGITNREEFEEKLSWLRQLLEWQQETRDPDEFMETLKVDLFTDEVFVFTPKGDVVDLPAESGPLDFAYRIHTDVGHSCVGAKVNGRIVPLNYKLKNGDIVEILTSKTGKPSRDWLNLVRTSQARNRIRNWFRREEKSEHITRGRELVEREIKKTGLDLQDVQRLVDVFEVAKRFNYVSEEDLYASIGFGSVSAAQVANRIVEEYRRQVPETKPEAVPEESREGKRREVSSGVQVKGVGDLLVRFARCCTPVPGDEIVGYITRGRGVSIHRKDCPNMASHRKNEPERFVDVSWDIQGGDTYPVDIEVKGINRAGFLREIVDIIAESKINISSVNAVASKDGMGIVDLTLNVADRYQLKSVMERLREIDYVYSVRRLAPGSSKIKKS